MVILLYQHLELYDLKPLVFFSLGYAKDCVYAKILKILSHDIPGNVSISHCKLLNGPVRGPTEDNTSVNNYRAWIRK